MSISSLGFSPFVYPTRHRDVVDASQFALSPSQASKVARGQTSEWQGRIDSEADRAFHKAVKEGKSSVEIYLILRDIRGVDGMGGISGPSFPNVSETASYAQSRMSSLTSAIRSVSDAFKQLDNVEETRAHYGDSVADRYKASALERITSGRRWVQGEVSMMINNFDVSGTIVTEREDGNFDLGSFTLSYAGASRDGKSFSALFHTADRAPTAETAKSFDLVQVLGGNQPVAPAKPKPPAEPFRLTSPAEAAEFAQKNLQDLKQRLSQVPPELDAIAKMEANRAVLGDQQVDEFKARAQTSLEIRRQSLQMQASMFKDFFEVSGDVLKPRPDGGFDLGSFSLRYAGTDRAGQSFKTLLYTADRAPTAEEAKTYDLAQLLDGLVRQKTALTIPGNRLSLDA